jgi:serine/threonine protein kinase
MLGRTLGGRYTIRSNLAGGGFGATFIAQDRQLPGNPLCVVKQLSPQSKDAFTLQTARRLFDTEAQVLYQLGSSHPQIPQLLAHFEENQQFYLVQEFIDGSDFSRELAGRKRLSETETVALLLDVLKILEFVHRHSVIHRDIKPSNLIRRPSDGKFVLIDFGAVKQTSTQIASGEPVAQTVAVGTHGYMAPEQANGQPLPCSDIYSLGAVAIQALTEIHPNQLPKDSNLEILWRDKAQVSPELSRILDKMVRYNFRERYQSAAEVLQALQQLPSSQPRAGATASKPGLFQKIAKLLFTCIEELLSGDAPQSPAIEPPPARTPPPATRNQEDAPTETAPRQDAPEKSARVFISYHSQDPDRSLAREFYQALLSAGHQPFMAGESVRLGEQWPRRIADELEQCDYFVLLLSAQSAGSEMVTEEVRKAKALRDARSDGKPVLLPIRVSFPVSAPLNYNLRGYLNSIQQRFWNSDADTPAIVRELLSVLQAQKPPAAEEATEAALPTLPPAAESPDAPPLPAAEPELPEGQVELASAFYVQRPPIETRACEEIRKPGALIRIKAPRQMGKTSLMARILQQAAQQGYRTVPLSFQLADGKVLTDLGLFLRWFCASVGRRLRLQNQVAERWEGTYGDKDNCTAYFEDYLLPAADTPLALGLDEVDRVFEHREIAEDFFGLLRAWHEEGKNREVWKQFRLVVVHSTEVYVPMNVNQSPFNVGLPVELPEFNRQQVLELARLHRLDWGAGEVEQLMAMVGGHPYLVRLALYHIARGDMTLLELLRGAPTEAGLYRDHLRRFLWLIQQNPELVEAFKQVAGAAGSLPLEPVTAFRLHSMGLVNLQGNEAILRCDLYRQYFGGTAKKQVEEMAGLV